MLGGVIRRPILLVLLALVLSPALAACPKGGSTPGGGGGMPAAVTAFPALRWVPADAAYVVAARTGADMSNLMREAGNVLGLAVDGDADDISEESRREFGFDILSLPSLRAIGIDTDASGALFSQALSPTIAVRLHDPAGFEKFLDGWREQGMSVQSQIEDGTEVFTVRFNRQVHISWAILDGWLLAHVALGIDQAPELAWLAAARGARGGFAGHGDFAAAVEASRAQPGAATGADGLPVIAVVRAPQLLATFKGIAAREAGRDAPAIDRCLRGLDDITRVLAAGGVADRDVRGAIVVELGSAAAVAAALLPAPAGWYAARAGAPVQVDLGVDLVAASGPLAQCGADLGGMIRQFGARTMHAFIMAFDGEMPAVAGAYADLAHDRAIRDALRTIPLLGQFSHTRKVGAVEVVDVDVPFVGSFSYHVDASRAIGAMGGGVIDAILGSGEVAAGELLHVELRPHDVPVEAWDLLLQQGLGVDRAQLRRRTIERLARWNHGVVDVRLAGDKIVVTASGTLRP